MHGQGTTPPGPVPPGPWTTDTLKADCAGRFTLCYELKAGDFANPKPSDCSLTKQCVTGDYASRERRAAVPAAPRVDERRTGLREAQWEPPAATAR